MAALRLRLRYAASLLGLATAVLAQSNSSSEQIWSAVVVTLYGDRIPLLSPDYSVITPLGAEQMFSAGQLFRSRYIDPAPGAGTGIQGIAVTQVNNYQLMPMAMYDIMIDQSAQAFLAGLYPPVSSSSDTASANLTGAALANGTIVNAPLDGLQYPQIYIAYETDPNYLYLSGTTNCPLFEESVDSYQSSTQFTSVQSSSQDFYNSLAGFVESTLPNTTLGYANSYGLWDYVSYEVIHSAEAAGAVDTATLNELRYLADQYNYQVYGNTTVDGGIRTISGMTLGSQILNSLYANIGQAGTEYKLSTYFTSYDAMIALTAILGLPAMYEQFTGMPNLGSSLVMELYTPAGSSTPTNGSYPNQSDMYVRFLFRNGTDSTDNLDAYPIFGQSEDAPDMTFTAFAEAMESIVDQVASPAGWCMVCASMAVWCAGYTDGADGLPSGPITGGNDGSSGSGSSGLSPVIAGVIGALVALAVAGLLLLVAMLLFGIRFRRDAKSVVSKRGVGVPAVIRKRNDLGGFKGSEKLASDIDLPKGVEGGVFGAEVVKGADGATAGHRRIESWELREGRGGARPNTAGGDEVDGDGAIKAVEAVSPV